MRVAAILLLIISLPATSCSKTDQRVPEKLDDNTVARYATMKGWRVDTRLSDHNEPIKHTGLAHTQPKTQDEVLLYAYQAWGLPKRATGKAIRIAFKGRGSTVDIEQSLKWVDALGQAGVAGEIHPKTIVATYLKEKERFQQLGMDFEEAVATIAGLGAALKSEDELPVVVRHMNEALLDKSVRQNMAKQGVVVECASGFDLLSQLDLAQRRYPSGTRRQIFLGKMFTDRWQHEAEIALSAQSRKTICDLMGQMRCARGYTQMQLERLAADETLNSPKVIDGQASAAIETVIRAVGR